MVVRLLVWILALAWLSLQVPVPVLVVLVLVLVAVRGCQYPPPQLGPWRMVRAVPRVAPVVGRWGRGPTLCAVRRFAEDFSSSQRCWGPWCTAAGSWRTCRPCLTMPSQ
jgi:hypothetical protein